MQNETSLTPWYKQPWPWILIALPLSVIIASFTTLYIAAHKPDSLVEDDYYKDGLGINRTLQHEQRAVELKLSAQGEIDLTARLVTLRLNGEQQPALLQLSLIHPTQNKLDHVVQLALQPDGRYRGTLSELSETNWYVRLEPQTGEWRLNGRLNWPAQQQWQLNATKP